MKNNQILEQLNDTLGEVLQNFSVTPTRRPNNNFRDLPEREKNMIRTLAGSNQHTDNHIAHVFDISHHSVRVIRARQNRNS